MSGLRPYPNCRRPWTAGPGRGTVVSAGRCCGPWRRSSPGLGSSVALDGVARVLEVEGTRQVARRREGAASLVVMTSCRDAELHRTVVEGRKRGTLGWYELDWDHVERARASWESPGDIDLVLEGAASSQENVELMAKRGACCLTATTQ